VCSPDADARKRNNLQLDDEALAQLRHAAEAEGRSQEDVLHDAVFLYARHMSRPREFALDGVAAGPGTSIAEAPADELLRGFGG
jgi:hypothetical protein